MKATDLHMMLHTFDLHNVARPLGMELSMASFRELRSDISDTSLLYGIGINATTGSMKVYGVDITPRRCTCGAHPEDQR